MDSHELLKIIETFDKLADSFIEDGEIHVAERIRSTLIMIMANYISTTSDIKEN